MPLSRIDRGFQGRRSIARSYGGDTTLASALGRTGLPQGRTGPDQGSRSQSLHQRGTVLPAAGDLGPAAKQHGRVSLVTRQHGGDVRQRDRRAERAAARGSSAADAWALRDSNPRPGG